MTTSSHQDTLQLCKGDLIQFMPFNSKIITVLRLYSYVYWEFLTVHQFRTIMLTFPNIPNYTLKVLTQNDNSVLVQLC